MTKKYCLQNITFCKYICKYIPDIDVLKKKKLKF